MEPGWIVKWVDYVTTAPVLPIVHIGIVIEHNKNTDKIKVMTSSGIQKWFVWQCEIIL